MSKQTINIGTAANAKNGDSLRAAFNKVNQNFTELYTALGLADTTLNLGAFTFTGSTMSTDDSTNIVIDKPITVNGEIVVDGDITPKTNLGASLGTPARQFKSLYVSNNTIFIGGTAVGIDANGNLTTNGTIVGGGGGVTSYADLTGKPTIPTLVSQLANDSGFLTSVGNISNIQSEGNINIEVNLTDSTKRIWQFGEDGNLTFPDGTNQSTAYTSVYAQSGATSAYATQRVLQYNPSTNAVTYSNYIDATSIYVTGYSSEIHVSPVAFDDSGKGTIGDPVKTIARAQALAALAFETTGVGQRKSIILHPGDYVENVTISTQYTVLTTHELVGKNTTLSGTLTITTGCTIEGLKITNLVVSATSATGSVDLIGCTVTVATTKTSSAYTVFRACDLSGSSMSITGSGTTVLVGGNYGTLTVNNAAAGVLVKTVVSMGAVTLTAGTLQLSDTLILATTSTSNAITTSAGSVITVNNCQTLVPALNNVARNSFGGYYSILHSVYDKTNSTFGGTSLNAIEYSQYINADRLILSSGGQITFPDATVQTTAYNPSNIRSEGNINIDINLSDSTLRRWQFGEDGSLTLPIGVSIDNNVDPLYPRIIADSGKAFSVQGQGNSGSTALAWTVNPDAASQYAAVSVSRAGGDNLAKVVLQAQSNSGDDATVKLWKFDETGALTIPGDIKSNGNINIDINLSDSTLRRWQFGEDGHLTLPAGGDIKDSTGTSVLGGGGSVSSLVNGAYTVSLGSTGTLTVPANGIITAPNAQEFQLQAKDANSLLKNEINLDPNNGTYMSVWRESTTSFSSADWGSGSWNNEDGLGAARFTDAQTLQDFWLTGPGSLSLAYEVSINGGARSPNVFYENNNGETYGVFLGLDAVPPGGQGTTVPITSLVFYYQTQSRINIDATGSEILLDAQSMDLDLRTTLNLDLRANENLNLRGLGAYPVRIYTNGTTHMWEFGADGNITLPAGFVTSNEVTGINLRSGYDVSIISNHMDVDREWTFGSDGDLTIPGDIKSTANTSIIIDGGVLFANVTVQTVDSFGGGGVWRMFISSSAYPTVGTLVRVGDTATTAWGTPITVTITSIVQDGGGAGTWALYTNQNITTGFFSGPGTQTITINSTQVKTWTFNTDKSLTFPDGTKQTTAWTGAPATLNVTGAVTAERFNTDQITVVGNRISTTVTNANLELECNGTGGVVINAIADATTASTVKSVGYLGLPQSATTTSGTLAMSDAGKHIYVTTNGQAIAIPDNSLVAYPIGTTLTFIAGPSATTVLIVINQDTLRLAGSTSTGTRTLAANGMATAVKVASTLWYINGIGLT